MFARLPTTTILAFLLACSTAGGSDPQGDSADTGSGTVDTDTVADSDVPADTPADTPTDTAPAGACVGASDVRVLSADEGGIGDAAAACGLACLSDADPNACISACLLPTSGLTDACNACVGEYYGCILTSCLAPCGTDPFAEACVACRSTECDPAFTTCSGLDATSAPL
jgi:hypothetical protein